MNGKQAATLLGLLVVGWHVWSFVEDAEQYKRNLARWRVTPTALNLARLVVAEGVLIKDVGWLM